MPHSNSTPLYSNGQPWRNAQGRNAPRAAVESQFTAEYAVVDLNRDPSRDVFLKAIVREFRIRCYRQKTITNYRSALSAFLRWYAGPLNQVCKEDVREFLELLVEGGASASQIGGMLSAIRTAFDKMCLLRCTVGLVTPRRSKKLPVVLSKPEVQRLIEAASSFRDKLLISVLYATGLRVSEVARLRWADLDFDRRQIRVDQGKGAKDRYVMLASHLVPLLRQVWRLTKGEGYLFPSEDQRTDRHLSTRTIERAVARARQLAKITKHATPHSLRHSFATHLIESGTDIRFIQKLLGHTNLETTSLYTKVAVTTTSSVNSPLDSLNQTDAQYPRQAKTAPAGKSTSSVGSLRIHVEELPDATGIHRVAVHVRLLNVSDNAEFVSLPGITVCQPRPGWINVRIPAAEQWQPALSRLNRTQVKRIEAPEFFELLQQEITRRLPSPAD